MDFVVFDSQRLFYSKSLVLGPKFSSEAQLFRLCDPMDCSTPGLPVHQQLLEFTQTHVHRVGDAIQPFHSLLSPSPPGFNLSQHQGLGPKLDTEEVKIDKVGS